MKTPLNQKQKNRLRRLLRVKDEGEIGIVKEINDLEDKVVEAVLRGLKGDKGDRGERGDAGRDGIDGKNGKDGRHGKDGKNGVDGRDGHDGQDGRNGLDGSPDAPQQIVEKLSSLEGDDRLDASAIKGLTELLEEAKRLLTPSRVGGFFGGRVAHIPMVDDFSTLTDGSTKTFYLSKAPRSVTTMKIWGSDFPYILRANTDFTVAGKLLTLTAATDAPSNGATLIVEYYV